ncbi:phage/plasmid primase, P4 family [Kribbella sp. CA-293567]|uniref:phage/plasmid primase, P4 family n=1 Tax=Kribbella sp. CA-293567 TaxID=3002436 RepID=UPI0022DE4122|nr:phage/plasmid primase, P4 family [Kribbella sp. CA-293567]WBQ03811.1 phage/plasmid primase, P4 family [Kribbella sp. CA-293567]
MDDFAPPGAPAAPAARLTLESFLGRFSEVDDEANGYAVICPSHPDTTPSLRVAYNADRKTLVLKCRVGCRTGAVVKDLGLTMADLFNVEPGDLTNVKSAGAVPEPVGIAHKAALRMYLDKAASQLPDSAESLAYAERRFGIGRELAASLGLGHDDGSTPSGIVSLSLALYRDTSRLVVPFHDFDGVAHYLQARALDPQYAGRAKWSGPANPDGAAWGRFGWFPGDLGWSEIFVTEGPGDGLTTVGAGYDTLLIRGAAMGLTDEILAELVARFSDRTFVIAGDNDTGGKTFNEIVGERLTSVGLSAVVLDVPAAVGDLSAWREADPATFYPALTEAVSSANAWTPPPPETPDIPNPAPTPAAEEDHLPATELANAIRLARRMKGLLRYTPALGFLVWNGAAWTVDKRSSVRAAAQQSALDLMSEALALPRAEEGSPEDKRRKAAIRWAHDSQRSRGIEAVMSEVKALPGIAVDAGDLDAHPDLLACSNGTVNLKTGQLKPADPADLLTKALDVDFVPGAEAPRWLSFLDQCFPDDADMPGYLRRLVGYGATGYATEQCYVMLHGQGGNGKSVFTSALYDVFAPITANVGIETFLTNGNAGDGGASSPDVAALRGSRLVLTSEAESGARMAEAKIKRLTGGDPVTARHLYKEPFTFFPSFLLMLSTNAIPEVRDNSDGIWRRVKIVEWKQQFKGARKDPALGQKLHAEREGILAWAVRGAAEWYRAGLGEPSAVTDTVNSHQAEADKLLEFFPGVIVRDPEAWISRKDLYAAYKEWSDAEGNERPWRNVTVYQEIGNRGVEQTMRKGVRGFKALRLRRPTDSLDSERANGEALTHLPDETDTSAPSLDSFNP